MPEEATTYEIIEKGTKLGKPKLVSSEGFGFTMKKGGKKGGTAWRCSVRSKNRTCHATIVQMGDTFTPGPREHCHPCDPGLLINTKLKARVKADALSNIFVSFRLLLFCLISDKYFLLFQILLFHFFRSGFSLFFRFEFFLLFQIVFLYFYLIFFVMRLWIFNCPLQQCQQVINIAARQVVCTLPPKS